MYVSAVKWIIFLIPVVTNAKEGINVYEPVNGQPGPYDWPNKYPGCGGPAQSPINIETDEAIYDPDLTIINLIVKPSSTFILQNNGHSIQVNIEGNAFLTGGGLQDRYSTAQFHFHWGDSSWQGSEHTVDNVSYPLEMHIVNWNSDKYSSITEAVSHPDGLAVLGILFEVSDNDNRDLEPMIQAISQVTDPDLDNRIQLEGIKLKKLLSRKARRFYRYNGSLTTPECQESVIWTVFERTALISENQLNVFRSCLFPSKSSASYGDNEETREPLVNNFRPVQPLNGRLVYKSFY